MIDAEQWLIDAWKGKVDHSKGRLIQSEVDMKKTIEIGVYEVN